jgi:hypothetical protein
MELTAIMDSHVAYYKNRVNYRNSCMLPKTGSFEHKTVAILGADLGDEGIPEEEGKQIQKNSSLIWRIRKNLTKRPWWKLLGKLWD